MNIYVGNLSYEITEEDLRMAFEPFGQVESAAIIKDKYSGQSKATAVEADEMEAGEDEGVAAASNDRDTTGRQP